MLILDNGANFLSAITKETLEEIVHNTSTYHPQVDGLIQNFDHNLQAMIAKSGCLRD